MNRRGMIATIDAAIFVTVLAVISITLVVVDVPEDTSPDASEVCDSISSITLQSDCIAEGSGNMRMNIWDISAASMCSGDTEFISGYLQEVLRDILTDRYGYEMTVSYLDDEMSFGHGKGAPLSECERDVRVLGGGTLHLHLTIYA